MPDKNTYEQPQQEPIKIYRDGKIIVLSNDEIETIYRSHEVFYDQMDCYQAITTYLEQEGKTLTQEQFDDASDRVYSRYKHDQGWALDNSELLNDIVSEVIGQMK